VYEFYPHEFGKLRIPHFFYLKKIVKEKILKKSSEAKKWKKMYVRIKRLSNFWFILKTLFFAAFQKRCMKLPPIYPTDT
jgi:hypothetical protein